MLKTPRNWLSNLTTLLLLLSPSLSGVPSGLPPFLIPPHCPATRFTRQPAYEAARLILQQAPPPGVLRHLVGPLLHCWPLLACVHAAERTAFARPVLAPRMRSGMAGGRAGGAVRGVAWPVFLLFAYRRLGGTKSDCAPLHSHSPAPVLRLCAAAVGASRVKSGRSAGNDRL